MDLILWTLALWTLGPPIIITRPEQRDQACLVDCLRQLVDKSIQSPRPGSPLWCMTDGNPLLQPFGLCLLPVPCSSIQTPGVYVVHGLSLEGVSEGHFTTLSTTTGYATWRDVTRGHTKKINGRGLARLASDTRVSAFVLQRRCDARWSVGCSMPPWVRNADVLGGAPKGDMKKCAADATLPAEPQLSETRSDDSVPMKVDQLPVEMSTSSKQTEPETKKKSPGDEIKASFGREVQSYIGALKGGGPCKLCTTKWFRQESALRNHMQKHHVAPQRPQ
jgi:hypothetical protein